MQGDGAVALSAPNGGALKSKFKILGGPEAELFNMDPGVAGGRHIGDWLSRRGWIAGVGNEGMPLQASDDELIAKWPRDVRQSRNVQRLDAIDVKRVEI